MTSFIRQTPLRFGKNQVRMRSLVEVKVTKAEVVNDRLILRFEPHRTNSF